MSQKYHLQKQNFIGGFSLQTNANNVVNSNVAWSIPINGNTSIIRMYSNSFVYSKYNGSANSSSYDYFIPENTSVDIYNIPQANTITFISDTGTSWMRVTQY